MSDVEVEEFISRLRENIAMIHQEAPAEPTDLLDKSADLLQSLASEVTALREALEPLLADAKRVRIFLSSREKMHPDGLAIFDEDVSRAREALANSPSPTQQDKSNG